jgi:hypothetical protein
MGRREGKTHKMLCYAISKALSGNNVAIIVHRAEMINYMQGIVGTIILTYSNEVAVAIRSRLNFVTMYSPEVNLDPDGSPTIHGYKEHHIFVDHAVWEHYR